MHFYIFPLAFISTETVIARLSETLVVNLLYLITLDREAKIWFHPIRGGISKPDSVTVGEHGGEDSEEHLDGETELIHATRGRQQRTFAPRIDTGAFEDLSLCGGPPLVMYPDLFEGNTLVTEPLVARARTPAEIGDRG